MIVLVLVRPNGTLVARSEPMTREQAIRFLLLNDWDPKFVRTQTKGGGATNN
jgi:hypothetical protein